MCPCKYVCSLLGSHGAGVTHSYDPSDVGAENLNYGPLQEQ